jgi:RNA polymerase sigma-70 factor (ECF subfamily)
MAVVATEPPRADYRLRLRELPVYPRPAMDQTLESAAPRTSEAWLQDLRSVGPARQSATADLHALLLRAARFELGRRRAALSHVRGEELDDIAVQAANDALAAVLAKLDHFRGASRFTTWAYKFPARGRREAAAPRLAGP